MGKTLRWWEHASEAAWLAVLSLFSHPIVAWITIVWSLHRRRNAGAQPVELVDTKCSRIGQQVLPEVSLSVCEGNVRGACMCSY